MSLEIKPFFVLFLTRIVAPLVLDVGYKGGRANGNKANTHVWPHCVVTGLSKISRQTGQMNSDTSLLASGTLFLRCAELKPPSIAISFLHRVNPPQQPGSSGTNRPRNDVTSPPGSGSFFKRETGAELMGAASQNKLISSTVIFTTCTIFIIVITNKLNSCFLG